MNQWQIWTVVKPTVGLPLLLGGVAVTSLVVHYAVLSHTTWMGAFFEGSHKKVADSVSSTAVAAAQNQPAFTVSVVPAATGGKDGASFVVNVTPNAAATPVTVGDLSSPAKN
jgi:light-harvesting protein B-800-850 alpha chain